MDHSTLDEDRYLLIGDIDHHGTIIAVFIEIAAVSNPAEDTIRIISARKVGVMTMKLKEATKAAKQTGKTQRVTEGDQTVEVKVSVTMRLDLDVLNKIKAEGVQKAIPYQTLINSILKQHVDQQASLEDRIERIEKRLFSSHE